MPAPFLSIGLSFQVDAGLLVEDVADMTCEVEGNGLTVCQCSDFCAGHVHGGLKKRAMKEILSKLIETQGESIHYEYATNQKSIVLI